MRTLEDIISDMVNNTDKHIEKIEYKPHEIIGHRDLKVLNREILDQYEGILIIFKEEQTELEYGHDWKKTWFEKYAFKMTDDFKSAVNNLKDWYNVISPIFTNNINNNWENTNYKNTYSIQLVKNTNSTGGKKTVVKHTVKQLQAIASKNNIKITKKVDGKTVRLNKQGLIAKLKRYKLI